MLVIALTGGIGSGKSTVTQLFEQLGAPVIDTDKLARDVVMQGTPGLAAIIQRFGENILHPHGELNRGALRQQVFQYPTDKIWLEQLLHPLIRQKMAQSLKSLSAAYCLVSIPLLFETTPNTLIQHILVIDTSESLQIARTIQRDQISAEQVQKIMAQQVSRRHRLIGADDVIYNYKNIEDLKPQVQRLHQKFSRGFISG